jgi:hypothetical protein
MTRRKRTSFYLFVVDHDQKRFGIEGPMLDDRPWIDRVVELQGSGRDIRCFTAPDGSVEMSAKRYAEQMGYTYSKTCVI